MIYKAIADLGVSNLDIRYSHILSAANGSGALPSLVSPYSKPTHKWRVIDFDRAYKVNRDVFSWSIRCCMRL